MSWLCGVALADILPVDGTTGAPLGGIGTGSIKFCSHNGTFAADFYAPCANPRYNQGTWKDFAPLANTQFQLFTDRGGAVQTSQKLSAVVTAGRADDDAIFPVQYANLGTLNNVSVRFTGFAPFDPAHMARMCYPYAFYELKVVNAQTSAVTVAVALQTQTGVNPALAAGKGFFTSTETIRRALFAASDQSGATVSVGSDNGFFTSGVCSNVISGTTNRVAVKVTLSAKDSAAIRFVFAWYNTDTLGANSNGARYWYTNAAGSAAAFADSGQAFFTGLKATATDLVTRMRASNVPGWIVSPMLNSMCNLVNNGVYLQDGRYCHHEGIFGIMGTMDQMWHARQMNTMVVPSLAWQELEWWARTQKTNPAGQIHHDFGGWSVPFLCKWDDAQHADYSGIDLWVDLNCGFIISVWEAFMATDDHGRIAQMWPYVKKAAQRVLDLAAQHPAAGYPYTYQGTHNSYDAGGNPDLFNAGLATVAYKIMTRLAAIQNEPALVTRYQNAFDTVCLSFTKRYLTNNFPSGRICESVLGGQWIGWYLKLGDFYPKTALEYGVQATNTYYTPVKNGLGFPGGSYNEWPGYMISHFGGVVLQTGNFPQWRALQYDWFERSFLDRNRVFNVDIQVPSRVSTPTYLATDPSGALQYIVVPVLWRNYYAITGFQRNKHTGELWIEPAIIPEMNHTVRNALIVTPEGYVTVSDTESGTKFQNQRITVKADNSLAVTTVFLRDKFGQNVAVTVNGAAAPFTRIGSGYSRELKVDWTGAIGPTGVVIEASGDTTVTDTINLSLTKLDPFKRMEAELYSKASSGVQIEGCTDSGDGSDVGYLGNNSFLAFDSCNFKQGAVACSLRVSAAAGAGGTIELHLDNATGRLVGSATVPVTGGWQTWRTVTCTVNDAAGIHNLYLVFKSSGSNVCNINWLVFKMAPVNVQELISQRSNQLPMRFPEGKMVISLTGAGSSRIYIFSINGKLANRFECKGPCRLVYGPNAANPRLRIRPGTYIVSIVQGEQMLKKRIVVFGQ